MACFDDGMPETPAGIARACPMGPWHPHTPREATMKQAVDQQCIFRDTAHGAAEGRDAAGTACRARRPGAFQAGIDEAGYGPVLGPLVICCVVAPENAPEEPHDWWTLLAPAVGRGGTPSEHGIAVGDSKVIMQKGVGALERGLSAFFPCDALESFSELLSFCHATLIARLPWEGALLTQPCFQTIHRDQWARTYARVRAGLEAHGLGALQFFVKLIPPSPFNAGVRRARNKHLFHAGEIFALLKQLPGTDGVVYIDRLGGRRYYRDLLHQGLGGKALKIRILQEDPGHSAYALTGEDASRLRIHFMVQGDRLSFLTALASMTAKYIRERYMASLNRYWQQQVPGIRATAGYPEDGKRFLREIAGAVRTLGFDMTSIRRFC